MGQTAEVEEALVVLAQDIAGWWAARPEIPRLGRQASGEVEPVVLDWRAPEGWHLFVEHSYWDAQDERYGPPCGTLWLGEATAVPSHAAPQHPFVLRPWGVVDADHAPAGTVFAFELQPPVTGGPFPVGPYQRYLRTAEGRQFARQTLRFFGEGTIPLDDDSTLPEIAFELLFCALDQFRFHARDYTSVGLELALVDALARAFPDAVNRLMTEQTREQAAVQLLGAAMPIALERGPSQMRAYFDKLSKVLRRRGAYDALSMGMSADAYYRLRRKVGIHGRTTPSVDQADVLNAELRQRAAREEAVEVRHVAQEVLEQCGFSRAAARKWLQRHPDPKCVLGARPRSPAGSERHERLSELATFREEIRAVGEDIRLLTRRSAPQQVLDHLLRYREGLQNRIRRPSDQVISLRALAQELRWEEARSQSLPRRSPHAARGSTVTT